MTESLGDIRQQILDQHRKIEGHLAELEGLARLVEGGDTGVDEHLRECGRVLLRNLEEHLDFEESHLLPRLQDQSDWGRRQARTLVREHADQRALFSFVLERLSGHGWTTMLMARQLRGFVQILRDDMEHEEEGLLSERVLGAPVIHG